MGFRKFLARLNNSRKGATESTDPAVPPRPQSQPGIRPSESTLPILQRRKPDSGATPNIPSVSGHHLPGPNADERKPVGLSSYIVDPTAAYENKPDWKSTLHASAGLVIDVVKESSDVFTPLKSVAGGLCAILKHYDQAMANRQSIESLIPRVEGLAESLSTPAPEGEIKEIERRQILRRKLEAALRDLGPLAERGKIAGFLNNVKDAETLTGLADDIRDAMMDYQTALQQDIYYKNLQLIDKVDLSLLKCMDHAAGAGFLAGDRHGCLKGTRRDVLLQIEQWLTDKKDQRVFWLNGLAGIGKSTITQTFSEISFADGKLGASFFCSRDFEDRSKLQAIFPTLAFQLAHRYPQFREQLLEVLKANHDVEQESLSSQLEKIIIRPLKETRIPTLIIIDALDECKDKEPASALLSVLSRYVHEIPQVKFFITGRPEPPIRAGFRLKPLRPITDVLKLHDVKRSSVDRDIVLFLRTRLTDIREMRSDCKFPEEWPTSHNINVLCKIAGGLFIYASTVVKFVASEYHVPTKRLNLIIHSQCTAHEGEIDLLYTQILQLAFQGAEPGDQELYSNFRDVVGVVLLIFNPLPWKALSDLVKNCGTPSEISATLRLLHSLLDVPDSEDEPIRVFHKSFPDFLTDPSRCKDDRFFVDPSAHHEDILFSCLDLMKRLLKKNICRLDDYAALSEVEDLAERKETYIGISLEYACRFWTRHLSNVPGDGPHAERVQEAIDEFFAKRLLCWIEVLSIVGHLGASVYAINDIQQWYISAGASTYEQADDSQRLVLDYFDAISDSPFHIYHSALPLSPSSSWVRECYKAEVVGEVRVLMGLPDRWDTCSRTILLEAPLGALACWGDVIAAGIESNVVLLDAITGIRTSVLSGHADDISSLAFSQDGTLLISGSRDHTAKLWDVQTGGIIRTFDDDAPMISAISISPDGTTVALGTTDGAIYLWSVQTEKCHSIKTGRDRCVGVVRFSPIGPQCLISSLLDRTIQQLDVDARQIRTSYHEAYDVQDIAYSPNGTRFVTCGGVATIRDSESGEVVVKLEAPGGEGLRRCCFSLDGRFVACAASYTIWVWDITNSGACLVGLLDGHSDFVRSLAFSPSLISGSSDQSVKVWQSSDFLAGTATADHIAALHGSTQIKSANLFAEDGVVVTSDESGVVKAWDLVTGRCKASFSTPAKGECDTHLTGDTLIIVWYSSKEGECHVWDVYNGRLLRRLSTSLVEIMDLKILGDGSKILGLESVSGDDLSILSCRIHAVSIQTGEEAGSVELHFWPDDGLFVRGSKVSLDCKHYGGWDFGGPEVTDFGEFLDRPRLELVSWPDEIGMKPRWVGDTVTKSHVFRLPERYLKSGMNMEFDGRYLLIWSPSGEVVIIDFDSVCLRL